MFYISELSIGFVRRSLCTVTFFILNMGDQQSKYLLLRTMNLVQCCQGMQNAGFTGYAGYAECRVYRVCQVCQVCILWKKNSWIDLIVELLYSNRLYIYCHPTHYNGTMHKNSERIMIKLIVFNGFEIYVLIYVPW